MRRPDGTPPYLLDVEASQLDTQALPGAVVIHLKREIASERRAGQPGRRMFIELTVSEAVQHWQALGELIRKAGALQAQLPSADSATNL